MASCNILTNISRTKAIDITSTESKFKRCLTTLDLTVLGMGTMMGSGLYVLTGVVAKETAGPGIIVSYIMAGLVSIMAGMCYAEFGSRVPVTGSAYTYTYVTIGEFWAFVIGWNLVLEYVVGAAAVARSWSGYFDELIGYRLSNFTDNVIFGGTPLNVPYIAPYPDLFSGLLTIFVLLFVILGANVSSLCNNVMVTINLTVVAFVFVTGLFLSDIKNWSDFFPYGISGVFSGAASCFFAFSGFDVIALSGEEAVDHVKSIPRATGFSIVFAGISYVAVSISLTLMVPYYDIADNASFSHAFAAHGLIWAKYVVGLGALCGMFTALLGSLFSVPRSVYAMANDGLLFTFLAKVSAGTQVPVAAGVIFGLLSAALAVIFDLSALVEFMSIGVLMAYAIVAGAVIVLRYRPNKSLIIRGNDEENEETNLFPSESKQNLDLITDIEGTLNRRFRRLKFMAKFEPGTVPCLCLFLTVIFQTLAIVVAVLSWKHDVIQEWWSILLLAIFGVLAIVSFAPILMHNQVSYGSGYNVPLVPYVPILSIFCDIVLMVMLKPVTWVRFAIWLGIGMLVYILYGYHHSVEGRQRARLINQQEEFLSDDERVTSPLTAYGTVVRPQPISDQETTIKTGL